MAYDSFEFEETLNLLTDNLNILVREAQLLTDRENLLEKKLKLAYEKYRFLANRFIATDPEIIETSDNLTIRPPDSSKNEVDVDFSFLPDKKHTLKISSVIEEARIAAQRLSKFAHKLSGSTLSVNSISVKSDKENSDETVSRSTILEDEHTVPERNTSLGCPFSNQTVKTDSKNCNESHLRVKTKSRASSELNDSALRQQGPLISASTSERERMPYPSKSSPICPIRLLGQHSPEEVAQYFETHKHEIPRSHEICVKRQQRNDYLIRKLDAKYGNLVSVIEGLGQKHQPLLPENEENLSIRNNSNERLEQWAKNVSEDQLNPEVEQNNGQKIDDRDSRFNRPMKEIRVGESPSRPWGISVPESSPLNDIELMSPRADPIFPISQARLTNQTSVGNRILKQNQCEKSPAGSPLSRHQSASLDKVPPLCEDNSAISCPFNSNTKKGSCCPKQSTSSVRDSQKKFIETPHVMKATGTQMSRMIFTGPVFIEYPTEEAIKILQHLNKA